MVEYWNTIFKDIILILNINFKDEIQVMEIINGHNFL
jgi:hypothetical protein